MGIKQPGDVLIFTKHTVLDAAGRASEREAEFKGDVAGHDFHGNRFTGGIGGSVHDAQARFAALKSQWAVANNDLLKYVNTPSSPEALKALGELRAINVQISQLQADPGTPQGMGMPGGPRDVVVIGAGPGGLSTAINAKADGLDTLVIDGAMQPGGQSQFSSRIENYPGFPAGVTGEQLASSMYDQATRLGADTQFGVRVTGITADPETGMKTLTLSDGSKVDARTVVIAGGVTQRTLDFPGGDAASVIYGDGEKVAQMSVGGEAVIIGGSNGAAQAALGAAESADHVTVFARTDLSGMSDYQIEALKSNPKIDVIQHEEIASYNEATGEVFAKDGYALSDVKAIGVFAGGPPDTSWLPSSIDLVKGSVAVSPTLETSMPGVYAVGDVRDGAPHRVLGAAADGQMAEKFAWQYMDAKRKGSKSASPHTAMVGFIDKMYHLDVAHPYSLQIAEGPHNAKAFRFEELKTRALAELKGDVHGHAFHGNRFTGGIGENMVNGLLSHAQWNNMIIQTFGGDDASVEAGNRDAMVEYRSEIANPEDPLDGKTFTDDKAMTAYVRDLAAKWTPGVEVVANHTYDWMETGGASYPQDKDNTFKIQMGRSYMNERVLLHEFSHILAAERIGEMGHGASFRQAYLDVLGSVRPDDAAKLRANYAKAPAPITKDATDDIMIAPMGMVSGPMGVVVCIGHVEEAKSAKGDVSGHAFHGNRWTGGLGSTDVLASPEEIKIGALDRYRLGGYAYINDKLRGTNSVEHSGEADWDNAERFIVAIDANMQPTGQPITVYRGLSGGAAAALLGSDINTETTNALDNVAVDKLVGTEFTDKGFVSTSKDVQQADARLYPGSGEIELEIHVPAGTKTLDVNSVLGDDPALHATTQGDANTISHEQEILLEHGLTYRIDGVSQKTMAAQRFNDTTHTLEHYSQPVRVLHVSIVASKAAPDEPVKGGTGDGRFVWGPGDFASIRRPA